MRKPPTVAASNLLALVEAAKSFNLDVPALLEEFSLSIDRLRDPDARVESSVLHAFGQRLHELTDGAPIGLRFAEIFRPTTYGALGVALLSSSTLRDFFEKFARYHDFVTTDARVNWDPESGILEWIWLDRPSHEGSRRDALEGWTATIIKWVRYVHRNDFRPLRVELESARAPGRDELYAQALGEWIEFDAPRTAIHFDVDELSTPLLWSNEAMAREALERVARVIAAEKDAPIVQEVSNAIAEQLPSGNCSRGNVARALNMSSRTMLKRLAEAGTSYRETLTRTREILAERYIRDEVYSVTDVAFLLGFSDVASFSRAFARWTGTSPSRFRGRRRRK